MSNIFFLGNTGTVDVSGTTFPQRPSLDRLSLLRSVLQGNKDDFFFYLFRLLSLHMILLLLLRCFLILYCEKMLNGAVCDLLAGSDCWTAEEKRYFNKGISAYRKDFFMVQKLVCLLISPLQYTTIDQHK